MIPFANVDVAVVEPTLRVDTERPPANVDVAVVLVALNVGDVTVPVKTPAPVTESGVPGDVVPMPRLPTLLSKKNCARPPAPNRIVEDANRPPWSCNAVVVACTAVAPKLLGVNGHNALPPVASTPQERTPFVDFTSQLAAFNPETTSAVVDAVPEMVSAVVEA